MDVSILPITLKLLIVLELSQSQKCAIKNLRTKIQGAVRVRVWGVTQDELC